MVTALFVGVSQLDNHMLFCLYTILDQFFKVVEISDS